jgi:hypothetical protein
MDTIMALFLTILIVGIWYFQVKNKTPYSCPTFKD